ncbi:MAG: hypothetical protein ACON4T_05990 [Synechococcus sp.]
MPRTPHRYAVSLHLTGGQTELIHFPTLDQFQQWYQGLVNAGVNAGFVNVPLGEDLEGEYLVVRPDAVSSLRVEPQFTSLDDA